MDYRALTIEIARRADAHRSPEGVGRGIEACGEARVEFVSGDESAAEGGSAGDEAEGIAGGGAAFESFEGKRASQSTPARAAVAGLWT